MIPLPLTLPLRNFKPIPPLKRPAYRAQATFPSFYYYAFLFAFTLAILAFPPP
jgi:hypothetical protein